MHSLPHTPPSHPERVNCVIPIATILPPLYVMYFSKLIQMVQYKIWPAKLMAKVRPKPKRDDNSRCCQIDTVLYQQKPFRWLGKCRVMMFRWKTRRKEVRKREERSFHAASMLRGRRPLGSQVGGGSAPAAPPVPGSMRWTLRNQGVGPTQINMAYGALWHPPKLT